MADWFSIIKRDVNEFVSTISSVSFWHCWGTATFTQNVFQGFGEDTASATGTTTGQVGTTDCRSEDLIGKVDTSTNPARSSTSAAVSSDDVACNKCPAPAQCMNGTSSPQQSVAVAEGSIAPPNASGSAAATRGPWERVQAFEEDDLQWSSDEEGGLQANTRSPAAEESKEK